jgi:hypothetical protein
VGKKFCIRRMLRWSATTVFLVHLVLLVPSSYGQAFAAIFLGTVTATEIATGGVTTTATSALSFMPYRDVLHHTCRELTLELPAQ